ncbi:MAG TPA: helix-turn-helix domain-containing protein [Thermoanaerobaculia bacterium]|nr:helix-turn-helix domain-containing protein [Thermoanaerobaculia bacterium]
MKGARTYTKVRRAAAEEATRERIVSALMALHEEIGPARTTVSAVAERAGVERLTVYRHFPDEPSMLRACSAHWNSLHPPPAICSPTDDPLADFRRTLLRLYVWYRENAAMLIQINTDARKMPVVAELIAPFADHLDAMAAELDRRWPKRNARRAQTIRHALDFSTWHSLGRIAGDDRRAAALAVSWLNAA